MKLNLQKFFSLLLIVIMIFSVVGCRKNEDNKDNLSSESTPQSELVSSEEQTASEENDEFDDSDFEEDVFEDVWVDEEENTFDINLITIDNASSPIHKNFLGINGLYNCFPYMERTEGRTYTEKQAQREMELVKKMDVKMVRSFYSSLYSYDEEKGLYNWESADMKAVYRFMKELQEADIEIGLNAGWQLVTKSSAQLDPYAGIIVKDDLQKTAENYAEWMKNSLLQFRAHGINNVTSLFLFTEPGGFNSLKNKDPDQFSSVSVKEIEDPNFELWLTLVKALDSELKSEGIRKDYLFVGPNEAHTYESWVDGTYYLPMFYQALTKANDYIDVFSHHNYLPIGDITTDVAAEQVELYWRERADLTKELTGKRFWIDEFNVRAKASDSAGGISMDDPWEAMQVAIITARSMNIGVQNLFLWSLASQNWNGNGSSADHWVNGVHCTGLIPSLYLSATPHESYYGVSLLNRYFGDGDVYSVDEGWMHSACQKDKDGNWSIVVVNTDTENVNFKVDFTKQIGNKTFYRYVYNTVTQTKTENAVPIGADLAIKTTDSYFYDTIPPASFAVYTTKKPE